MHILVAHDNPRFLAPLATALRSVGHEVTACDNAMSAWDALNSASIDLLITQTQFPFPQPDGVALALKARGIEQDLRIVFMAAAEAAAGADAEELGTCLTSPISVAEVVAAVAHPAPNSSDY
jgi:DNA-binding response OmpR family regulator